MRRWAGRRARRRGQAPEVSEQESPDKDGEGSRPWARPGGSSGSNAGGDPVASIRTAAQTAGRGVTGSACTCGAAGSLRPGSSGL